LEKRDLYSKFELLEVPEKKHNELMELIYDDMAKFPELKYGVRSPPEKMAGFEDVENISDI
jgi:hypothetical protein